MGFHGIDKDAFSKSNAENDSKFISYKEVIESLSNGSGEEFSTIARSLKLNETHQKYAAYLYGIEGAICQDNGEHLAALLDNTIEFNKVNGAVFFDGYNDYNLDSKTHGWYRDNLIMELEANYGFFITSSEDNAKFNTLNSESESQKTESILIGKLNKAEQELSITKSKIEILKQELEDAQKTVSDLIKNQPDQSAIAIHNKHLMKIALEVQRDYWGNLKTQLKQEILVPELRRKYSLTKSEAQAVERVSCPHNRSKKVSPLG